MDKRGFAGDSTTAPAWSLLLLGSVLLAAGTLLLLLSVQGTGPWAGGVLSTAAGVLLLVTGGLLACRVGDQLAKTGRAPAAAPAAPRTDADRRAPGPGPTSRPRPATTVPGPLALLNRKGDTELTTTASGITVRDKWPRPGGTSSWKVRITLVWGDITGLVLDYGSHDSVQSLYAVPGQGRQRHHVLDSRTFTADQWEDLASSVSSLTGGRLGIDLTQLNAPGRLRDS
ncbi:hypothetical protein ACH4CD_31295 [Streptomyces fungicidicus]|uniref:hypothetical protein n=1 Tax=Streptomyces fungicidicus TaxID=68203 RepID=UPI0037A79843